LLTVVIYRVSLWSQTSEGILYSPAITPGNNDIEEVEEEIYDCRYPYCPSWFSSRYLSSLPEFIDSVDEAVESRRSSVF